MHLMKNILMLFLLLAIGGVLCVPTVQAIAVPMLDATELEKGAQVIVVGEVASKLDVERGVYKLRGHDVTARVVEATIRVERTLKGRASIEYKVRYYEPDAMLGYDWIGVGRYGAFFLKRNGDHYTFVSPYYVSIVAARGACESTGDPLVRITAEMNCVLRAKDSKTIDRFQAINALDTIKTKEASAALKTAAQEQPEPLNYLAADELIKRGDLTLLPLAEHALQKSFEISIKEEGFSMATGWNSIEGISDKRAIPTLSRLVHAPDVRTQKAALRALGHTKDAAAVAPLLEGLDETDVGVRWYAVMGFAELADDDDSGGEWYPDFKRFEEKESLYITHWRDWALQQSVTPVREKN